MLRPPYSHCALSAALFTLPAFVWSTPTFPAGTPSGIGCVDPQGLVDCYSNNVDQATSCLGTANNSCSADLRNTCALGCANGQLAANVGCWLQHCWNQVSAASSPHNVQLINENSGVLLRLPGHRDYLHRQSRSNREFRDHPILSATCGCTRRLLYAP
jgi:hypothetical protein